MVEEGIEGSGGLCGASSQGIRDSATGNMELDPAHMVCYAGRAGKARGGCEKAGEGAKIRICRFSRDAETSVYVFRFGLRPQGVPPESKLFFFWICVYVEGPWWRDLRNADGWQIPWLG